MDMQNLTPEQDMEIYQNEAAAGNLEHAFYHLACALSRDPENEEWLACAKEQWGLLGGEVFTYLDITKNNYFAVIALHAYYLFQSGNYDTAVSYLVQVQSAIQDAGYFPWIAEWAGSPQAAAQISERTMYQMISGCLNDLDAYTAERGMDFLHDLIRIFEAFPESTEGISLNKYIVLSMLWRRAGNYQEALKAALNGYEKFQTANSATFVALCYKEMGELGEMERFTRIGISMDPENRAICNDMADAFLSQRNYRKAAEYYSLVLEKEEDDWAEPSLYYCRYMEGADEQELLKLEQCADGQPEDSRACALMNAVNRSINPEHYLFYEEIPYSHESLANLLHQISSDYSQKYGSPVNALRAELSGGKPMRSATTCLESPSSIHALRLYLSDYGRKKDEFEFLCQRQPEPSPLEPMEREDIEDAFRLWNYDGSFQFEPAGKEPAGRLKQAAGELASAGYSLASWYEEAERIVREYGLQAEDKEGLEGVMLFPPECPDPNYYMDCWLMRVQFAAVFLIAAVDALNGKVPSPSLKRIIFGQLDWPVLPALLILSYQTHLKEECADEVYAMFTDFIPRIYRYGYCNFMNTFLVSLLNLQGLGESDREYFKAWLMRELNEEEDSEEEQTAINQDVENLKGLLKEKEEE